MKYAFNYIIAIILSVSLMCGCENTSAFLSSPQGQTTKKVALNILLSAASVYANNGKMDSAWAVPLALNSISDIVAAHVDNKEAASLIQGTITNFASDSTSRDVAKKLAAAFVKANPQTPEARKDTVVALATGASDGLSIAKLY